VTISVSGNMGNATGGGTNTNGVYYTYAWDATNALPQGVCEQIPTHSGGALCQSSDAYPGGETLNLMLGPSDAIVFYGCTPPPVDYFGLDFIITTRINSNFHYALYVVYCISLLFFVLGLVVCLLQHINYPLSMSPPPHFPFVSNTQTQIPIHSIPAPIFKTK
jgi:hypothetical protein